MEKIKLLVVDDIPQTRKDITRLLYFEDDMIVVGEGVDGADALRKIGELQPDVVLMDINMPQMDGISATERACQLYPQVAVVIISIQGESEYLKKAMVAGARDYLVKPLGSDEMATTIRSVHKQQRRRIAQQVSTANRPALHPEPVAETPFRQNYDQQHQDTSYHRSVEQIQLNSNHHSSQREQQNNYDQQIGRIPEQGYGEYQDQPFSGQPNNISPPMQQGMYHQKRPGDRADEPLASQYERQQQAQNFRGQESIQGEYSQQNGLGESTRELQSSTQQFDRHPKSDPSPPANQSPNHQQQLDRGQESGSWQQGNDPQQNHQQDPRTYEENKHGPSSKGSGDFFVSGHPEEEKLLFYGDESKFPALGGNAEFPPDHISSHHEHAKPPQATAGATKSPVQQPTDASLTKAPAQQQFVTQPSENPLGLVFAAFCGKGGVGKTTIATNLAVMLAQQEKKKVALIDYDLQFGDVSVLLNLSDGQNIGDLIKETGSISEELLESYMIRHFTGIDILPAPLFPQDAEYITSEHTDEILRLLKKSYDYIIVDTAATFNEINLQVLDMANHILLVTTRDIVTIKNTKTSLNILESLDYRDKIRVVLNRCDQDLGVTVTELEKGLEITVSHQISTDDKALVAAINKGVPVVVSHSGSEITRSFKRLSDRLIGSRQQKTASKSIINRMFSL